MLEGGCDIYSLSRMMGHSDIKTTTIYWAASAEHLRLQMTKHPLNDMWAYLLINVVFKKMMISPTRVISEGGEGIRLTPIFIEFLDFESEQYLRVSKTKY